MFIIPLAALLATLPVILHGCSCGHDFDFHLQSWLDAAQQLRHGTLYPQWTFSAAWNAGEPRFLFYPPVSWLFGALLTLIFPIEAIPQIFIFSVLTAAGCSMYALARRFATPNAALLAACVYLATPYMLFNAFERSAYAELLASIWIPLLFLSVFRNRPTLLGIAPPLALAWLTNIPAGIMATYTFVFLAALRLLFDWRSNRPDPTLRPIAFTFTGGLTCGLALPAFYLLPAIVEHRYVQSTMAIIPNLRYQDNFLFSRTSYEPHNIVTHTVSVLAVVTLAVAAVSLSAIFLFVRPHADTESPARRVLLALTVVFAVILFLVLPLSAIVWRVTPELPFLQFPWRLLTILSAVLSLSIALLLRRWTRHPWLAAFLSLAVVATLAPVAYRFYAQECDEPNFPQVALDLFHQHHGVAPTDEYTPNSADNDVLRPDDPAFWLVPADDAEAYAPNTVPNPNEADPNWDDTIPPQFTVSQQAPSHLDLNLPAPAVLVLNLRDYPDWRLTRTANATAPEQPPHLHRDDGLLAVPLPAGPSHLDLRWHRGPDVYAGDAISLATLVTLLTLLTLHRRSRKIEV